MCTGCSPASWRMYSPRSVSTGVTPAAESASFSPISSVAIDFDFAASFAPESRHTRATYSLASSPVRAKKTLPPRASNASVNRATCPSRSSITDILIWCARSRSASTSGSPSHAATRFVRSRFVAVSSAACVCASPSFPRAISRKRDDGCASSVIAPHARARSPGARPAPATPPSPRVPAGASGTPGRR